MLHLMARRGAEPTPATSASASRRSCQRSRPAALRRLAVTSRAPQTTAAMLEIAYNSCRNRHCPKCQGRRGETMAGSPARRSAAGRLLSPRLHPAGANRANRVPEQDRRLRPAVQGRRRDADRHCGQPKTLGARVGFTAVLHTWGSALTHHPHLHMIVPGGGLSSDGSRWIACKPRFFLARQGAVAPVPAAVSRRPRGVASGRAVGLLRRSRTVRSRPRRPPQPKRFSLGPPRGLPPSICPRRSPRTCPTTPTTPADSPRSTERPALKSP